MIGDDLYKRGYDQPLLKCVTAEQAQYIIKELHEGIWPDDWTTPRADGQKN